MINGAHAILYSDDAEAPGRLPMAWDRAVIDLDGPFVDRDGVE